MFDRSSDLTESSDLSNGSAIISGISEPSLDERRKSAKKEDKTGVYRKGCEINQSTFSKLMLHPRLTRLGRKVLSWFIQHLGNKNFVGAPYPKIANSTKISVSSIRRGCAVLEDVNFMVRVSRETRQSLWLVNPDYLWKGFRSEHAEGKAMYSTYRKKADEDARAREKAGTSLPEINENPENCDIMPIDFSYSHFNQISNDEETELCELKSKAA